MGTDIVNISNPESLRDQRINSIANGINACWENILKPYENSEIEELDPDLLYQLTSRLCFKASVFLKRYLEKFYPGIFEIHIFDTRSSIHFPHGHFVAVITDKATDKTYISSPANAINIDFTFPLNPITKRDFDRMRDIIVADNVREALDLLKKVEGGEWKSYEGIVPELEDL